MNLTDRINARRANARHWREAIAMIAGAAVRPAFWLGSPDPDDSNAPMHRTEVTTTLRLTRSENWLRLHGHTLSPDQRVLVAIFGRKARPANNDRHPKTGA